MTPETEKQTFVTEKIKDKPVNKKRLLTKVGTAALCGLVFALFAMGGMALGMPLMAKYLRNEIGAVHVTEANLSFHTEEIEEVGDSELTESTEILETEEDVTETLAEEGEPAADEATISLQDYQDVLNDLYAIGKDCENSLVTITSLQSENDWFNIPYEAKGTGTGVIISETESSYLLLTERSVLQDDSRILVTFAGNIMSEATIVAEDANIGIAVVRVDKQTLDPGTLGRVKVLQIGNSHRVRAGDLVLALGTPVGSNRSIVIGNIISTNSERSYQDSNYSCFVTNMEGYSKGSGILVNMAGEIIGLIIRNSAGGTDPTLTALAVTDMEALLRLMINGNSVPYAGLFLRNITHAMEVEYGLPSGVYIREVAMDSPAMNAGLQSGDIITAVGGLPITSDVGFRNQILQQKPGENCQITVLRAGQDDYDEVICDLAVGVMEP